MKKIVIASLLFTGSVYADDFKPWTIFASTFSSNYTLPSRFENVQLAYKAGVQYNVTENLYMQAKTIYYPSPSSWSFGGLLGVAASHGLLRPYGELSVNFLQQQNRSYLKTVDYDAGINIVFNKCIVPYLAANDFVSPGKESFTTGINFYLLPELALGLEYNRNVENKGEGANMKLAYNF